MGLSHTSDLQKGEEPAGAWMYGRSGAKATFSFLIRSYTHGRMPSFRDYLPSRVDITPCSGGMALDRRYYCMDTRYKSLLVLLEDRDKPSRTLTSCKSIHLGK